MTVRLDISIGLINSDISIERIVVALLLGLDRPPLSGMFGFSDIVT